MKLRILFLGDTGVGKTSLIQNLCLYSGSTQNNSHDSLRPTKGFHISCTVLPIAVEKRETVEKKTIVELWEWGCGMSTHPTLFHRALSYIPFDGFVFVYDLTISTTRDSIWKYWAVEVLRSFGDSQYTDEESNAGLGGSESLWSWKRIVESLSQSFLHLLVPFMTQHWKDKLETHYLYQLSRRFPVAVVGTKSDIWSQRRKLRLHHKSTSSMESVFYCQLSNNNNNHRNSSSVEPSTVINRTLWNFFTAVARNVSNKRQ
jgi:hypothetical protein